jgi:hypothetical protein
MICLNKTSKKTGEHMNQIINMIIRQLTRRLINTGIEKGVGLFNRKKDVEPNSAESKQVRVDTQQTVKTAKQSMRMIRRIGRF